MNDDINIYDGKQIEVNISISGIIILYPVRSGEQCSRGVGYYAQMVWQNTTHVGCGWTQFQYRGFEVIIIYRS